VKLRPDLVSLKLMTTVSCGGSLFPQLRYFFNEPHFPSMSPGGGTNTTALNAIAPLATMARVTDDFWDHYGPAEVCRPITFHRGRREVHRMPNLLLTCHHRRYSAREVSQHGAFPF